MDNIPRQTATLNSHGLDKLQLSRRKHDMKLLKKQYPNLPDAWLEMAWNFVERTPPEEVHRIIESGDWEKPPANPHRAGGVVPNGITVSDTAEPNT